MGMQTNLNGNEYPSNFEELREIVMTVEPRLRPIPEIRMHVSRFLDGADMDEVYPKLFLGDCDAAMNEAYLRKNGITHILNAAGNTCGPAPVKTGQSFYKDPSLVYLGLNLIDLPFINVSVHFEKGSTFIEEALSSGGKVLVHCRQGRSRSASIVAAFLMMHRGMTAANALTMLRKKREIRPNNGFLHHLANLDLNLFRMKQEKMREESSSSSSPSLSSSPSSDCEESESELDNKELKNSKESEKISEAEDEEESEDESEEESEDESEDESEECEEEEEEEEEESEEEEEESEEEEEEEESEEEEEEEESEEEEEEEESEEEEEEEESEEGEGESEEEEEEESEEESEDEESSSNNYQ